MADPVIPRPVAAGAFALRGVWLRLAAAILPPEVAAWRLGMSFATTRVLGALVEHGVLDALGDGRATAPELARRLDLDADMLHRLLRAAATDGVVRVDRRGRFRLTRVGRRLRSADERSMAPWIRYLNRPATQDAWANVGASLRTGEPSFPLTHGRSVWAHLAAHPDEEREFAAAMRNLTRMALPYVVRGYDWPHGATVCDVAGGVGTVLAAVLDARPDLRGVLVDAPGPLAEARTFLAAAGVAERVELSPGDLFAGIDARADVYVLKDVLHDWDDERSLRILRTVRAAAPSGARIVLVETLQEPNTPEPIASLVDVHMLTQCDGGRQRSADELRALLTAAGFSPLTVHRTAGAGLVDAATPRKPA